MICLDYSGRDVYEREVNIKDIRIDSEREIMSQSKKRKLRYAEFITNKIKFCQYGNLYSKVSKLTTLEDFEELQLQAMEIIKPCTDRGMDKSLALAILSDTFSITEKKFGNLESFKNSLVTREEFFGILDRCFGSTDVMVQSNMIYYSIEDFKKPVVRCEVLYILTECLIAQGNRYEKTVDDSNIYEVLLNCYNADKLYLDDVVSINNSMDIRKYQHSTSFSNIIENIKGEQMPVPYPLISTYAELINNELADVDMIGDICVDDMFIEETHLSLARILMKFIVCI